MFSLSSSIGSGVWQANTLRTFSKTIPPLAGIHRLYWAKNCIQCAASMSFVAGMKKFWITYTQDDIINEIEVKGNKTVKELVDVLIQ